jgi:hypothetical protein
METIYPAYKEADIGWKSLGKILCGHVTQPGDTEGKPEVDAAYRPDLSL